MLVRLNAENSILCRSRDDLRTLSKSALCECHGLLETYSRKPVLLRDEDFRRLGLSAIA